VNCRVNDLDEPIPDNVLGSQEHLSVSVQLVERAKREKPTIREMYLRSGLTGSARIGTATDIVDVMQEWFEAAACDGFNITPATLPGGGTSSSSSFPNCSAAACFVLNMKARPCAKILGCGRWSPHRLSKIVRPT
jgi:alkanesulfonate monooxygenase SsuD/methylene tetrahydromethanopterin reductase-like flavin-dependent oxidoreductase (luciferase family)